MSASAVTSLYQGRISQITPDEAREQGFVCLTPLERAVAIEFATTGHTLRQVAKDLGQPFKDVREAFGSPITRALIHDLQAEIAQHKVVNAAWVEQQVLSIWPQLIGEEAVYMINKSGEEVHGRKFHGPEVTSLLKHFSGNRDQKDAGGVQVVINFGDMGVNAPAISSVDVIEGERGD